MKLSTTKFDGEIYLQSSKLFKVLEEMIEMEKKGFVVDNRYHELFTDIETAFNRFSKSKSSSAS